MSGNLASGFERAPPVESAAALAPPGALHRAARRLLAPLACLGVLLHVSWGLLCALLLFPLVPQAARNRMIRVWSRMMLRTVGVRLHVVGGPPDAPGPGRSGRLLVANHVSWLDIFAIDAIEPARFIAKSEITRWPLVGWLVALAGTLFVERGRRHAVAGINRVVGVHLRRGETIAIFPEGTTSDGRVPLPFHANLIQPALDSGAEVRPLAIRYAQDGRWSPAAAYVGETTLVGSLWRVVTAPRLTAVVHWLPPLPTGSAQRHAVARAARDAIAATLGPAGEAATSPTPARTEPA